MAVTYVTDAQTIAVMNVCMKTAHPVVVLKVMVTVLAVQMVTIWVTVIAVIVVRISNVNVPLTVAALDVFLENLIRVFIVKKVALVTVSNVHAKLPVQNVLLENMAYPVNMIALLNVKTEHATKPTVTV